MLCVDRTIELLSSRRAGTQKAILLNQDKVRFVDDTDVQHEGPVGHSDGSFGEVQVSGRNSSWTPMDERLGKLERVRASTEFGRESTAPGYRNCDATPLRGGDR